MALPLELGGIDSPDVQRALQIISAQWPTPIACTTAKRPPAARAGRGAQLYDTTLSKPLWSDGVAWRDAAGTLA